MDFRLLLLTGCRMSEIRDLRWDYVKDDCIELPDAKTGGRVVPLGPEARAVLSSIPREEDNPWVIAGRLPGSHLTEPARQINLAAHMDKNLAQCRLDLATDLSSFHIHLSVPLFLIAFTSRDSTFLSAEVRSSRSALA